MRWRWFSLALGGAAFMLCAPVLGVSAWAKTHATARGHGGHGGGNCVAYAREVTGVHLSGNAGLWWNHAEGRYERGHKPTTGAILVFKPYGRMHSGHVAVVSRVVGTREILVDHANWVRGRITTAVSVVDVSAANDWSLVKVSGAGGRRDNPVYGFIYPRTIEHETDTVVAAAPAAPRHTHAHAHDRGKTRLASAAEAAALHHALAQAKARFALAEFRLDLADRPRHHAKGAHDAAARVRLKPADLAALHAVRRRAPDLVADRRREHPKREEVAVFY